MFKIKLESYSTKDALKQMEFEPTPGGSEDPLKFTDTVHRVLLEMAEQKATHQSCVGVDLLDPTDRAAFLSSMHLSGYGEKADTSFHVNLPDRLVFTRGGQGMAGHFDALTDASFASTVAGIRKRINDLSAKLG